MPILERDPWREQYFTGEPCPDDVDIPTDDGDAYMLFPKYKWVYNKLLIAESQGVACAPHGFAPERYPVFSKPIYNMRGMGTGSLILKNEKDYVRANSPGHMWMELFEGEHVSSDAAVVDGEPTWWRHSIGIPIRDGMFDHWVVLGEARPEVESYCGDWLRTHLKGYTGMVNFETMGARIIECHLRFSDQFPDLYGAGWVKALVRLYAKGDWDFADSDRRDGFSVVLFGAHGLNYKYPDPSLVAEILAEPEVSSVQITFHEGKPPAAHAMPPGGFRLAIVNGPSLETGIRMRERLALSFWSTMSLGRGRRRKAS